MYQHRNHTNEPRRAVAKYIKNSNLRGLSPLRAACCGAASAAGSTLCVPCLCHDAQIRGVGARCVVPRLRWRVRAYAWGGWGFLGTARFLGSGYFENPALMNSVIKKP